MRYLSVCSGIEAASVAWNPLRWEPVAFSEIDKFPSSVLAHHYPDVPNHGDMTRFEEWPDAAFDVLCGGTPCQSFSVAGLRKGLDDPRGNLTLTYLAIVERFRPEWVVWENVPGILSDATGAFGAFLGGLGQLGYGFAYRILDAQYFGVAQRRRRVFVVGSSRGWQRAAAVLFERDSLSWNSAPSRETGQSVAGTFTSRSRSGGWTQNVDLASSGYMQPVSELSNAICSRDYKGSRPEADQGAPLVVHSLRADGFDASEDGTGRGTPLVACDVADSLTVGANQTTGFIGDCVATLTGNGDAHSGFKDEHGLVPIHAFYANESFDSGNNVDVSPTVKVGSGGSSGNPVAVAFQEAQTGCREYSTSGSLRAHGPGHDPVGTRVRNGMQVRRLTPRECERLQGFPDDYTLIPYRGKYAADGPRYKALGNSMAVPVMRWIGERINLLRELVP